VADLSHICRASTLAADLWLPTFPTSPELAALADAPARWHWQASGGDDYELCFTAAPAERHMITARLDAIGVAASRIGRMYAAATADVRALDKNGSRWQPARAGFVHFR